MNKMSRRLINWYSRLVTKRPFITQVGTAGILTTAGDLMAQSIEKSDKGYDFKRTGVMSAFGFCYFGPALKFWLAFLRKLNLSVLMTVAIDQAIFAPSITAGFVFLHPVVSGKNIEEARCIFKNTYCGIVKAGWSVWVPAQTINFLIVPFQFRMLYIQCVALMWNTFLSYRSNSSLKDKSR